jgi:hypothetical protein
VLIGSGGNRAHLPIGYLAGGRIIIIIIIIGGVDEALTGIDAEGKPLEAVVSAHRGWLG